MIQVQDKETGEIVSQIFNFVDNMGGPPQTLEGNLKFITLLLGL